MFRADGRFITLKYADWSALPDLYSIDRLTLGWSPDGTYTYTKTGPETATVLLDYDDSSDNATLYLEFTTPTGRPFAAEDTQWGLTWSLTEAAAIEHAPALNVSTRGTVSPGHPMIVGFVVPGVRKQPRLRPATTEGPHANERDVLIRVVGPSLTKLGVGNTWSDPSFAVHSPEEIPYLVAVHQNWGERGIRPSGGEPASQVANGFEKIFSYVGAFPLLPNSKDAAAVMRLGPGVYTIVAHPAEDDPGGEVLVEVYFLP